MALAIASFEPQRGASVSFKALGHPLVSPRVHKLLAELAASGPLAVFDPEGLAGELFALYPRSGCRIAERYVQRVEDLAAECPGPTPRTLLELPTSRAEALLVASFDAARLIEQQLAALAPQSMRIHSLDEVRLPDAFLSRPGRLLDPLNFATNLALFRDDEAHHTELVTANYWSEYGAGSPWLWLCLFDAEGRTLAAWREQLPRARARVQIDSREVRRRFGLGPFCGSLFLHAVGIAGHDVVKYALDDFDPRAAGSPAPSTSHDANAWPADLYAGIPAPGSGERVLVWVQNPHPTPIPAGAIGMRPMGGRAAGDAEGFASYGEEIPAYGTRAIEVGALLEGLAWPAQIELRAGRHFPRPRYEVVDARGRRHLAHANVERSDLAADPALARLAPLLGKGFLLPAPILPPEHFRCWALPTPMSTQQRETPLELRAYAASGRELARERLGPFPRDHRRAIDLNAWLDAAGVRLAAEHAHVELLYDFSEPTDADGWLHALFRYEHLASGRRAETSFGSHVFNLPLSYRSEPQSYAGRPPGLSTRLFLRLAGASLDTFCVLIYPASGRWRAHSSTELWLRDGDGRDVALRELAIPLGGSHCWRASELYSTQERLRAGPGGYVVVRDRSCRLFGYQGLLAPGGAFSLDHLFGF